MTKPRTTKAPSPLRADRMATALTHRSAGKSYRAIGVEMGLNPGDAFRLVQDAIRETFREPAEDVLTLELDRLDMLLTAILPGAMKGDERAVLRVLNIMDRRARYLGLDKVTPPDVSQEARGALTGLMEALTAAATPAGQE